MGTPMRVLVIDDDPIALEVTASALRAMGHHVECHEQAFGATAAIAAARPDVVLVDVGLPGLSGNRLVEIGRKRWPDGRPKFILHSARDPEELEALVKESGPLGAIHKTPHPAAFREAFEALVLGRPAPDPAAGSA